MMAVGIIARVISVGYENHPSDDFLLNFVTLTCQGL